MILFLCYLFIALQNAPPGAVLVGSITYGTVSTFNKKGEQNHHAPVSYSISYTILPSKVSSIECTSSQFSTFVAVMIILVLVLDLQFRITIQAHSPDTFCTAYICALHFVSYMLGSILFHTVVHSLFDVINTSYCRLMMIKKRGFQLVQRAYLSS